VVSVGTVKGIKYSIRFWALICGYDFFFLDDCIVFDYLVLKEKAIQRGRTCLFAFLASMAFYTSVKSMQWPLPIRQFFFFFQSRS
jgi:hypothetical protein